MTQQKYDGDEIEDDEEENPFHTNKGKAILPRADAREPRS
jgi:hypothetical protein